VPAEVLWEQALGRKGVKTLTTVHAFDQPTQPPAPKRRRPRPGQLEKMIKSAIVHQSVDDVLALLQMVHPAFVFPKRTRREIEKQLHLQRLRDLGMSAGEIAIAIERTRV
jgi:hypothetical protein